MTPTAGPAPPNEPASRPPRRWGTERRGSVLRFALLLALAYLVLVHPFTRVVYPPIFDLPFHAAMMSIVAHHGDPAWGFRGQFELDFPGSPYWTFTLLGAALESFLPVSTAAKIACVALLSSLPLGLAVLFAGMKRSPLLGVLALPLTWNRLTHWGFLNFLGGIGLTLAAVGIMLFLVRRPTLARQAALLAVLLLVFTTHVYWFPFALVFVVGGAALVYPSTRRFRPVLWPAAVPGLLFTAWFLIVRRIPVAGLDAWGPELWRVRHLEENLWGAFEGPAEGIAGRIALAVFAAVLIAQAASALRRGAPDRRWTAGTAALAALMTGSAPPLLRAADEDRRGMVVRLPPKGGRGRDLRPRLRSRSSPAPLAVGERGRGGGGGDRRASWPRSGPASSPTPPRSGR